MTVPRPRPRPRPNWSWQEDGLCRGQALGLFFGPDFERQPQRDLREQKAKAICAECPVKVSCLDYALARPEQYGTWGGLTAAAVAELAGVRHGVVDLLLYGRPSRGQPPSRQIRTVNAERLLAVQPGQWVEVAS